MIISVTSEIRLENRSGEIYEIVYYAETFCGEYNHISEAIGSKILQELNKYTEETCE